MLVEISIMIKTSYFSRGPCTHLPTERDVAFPPTTLQHRTLRYEAVSYQTWICWIFEVFSLYAWLFEREARNQFISWFFGILGKFYIDMYIFSLDFFSVKIFLGRKHEKCVSGFTKDSLIESITGRKCLLALDKLHPVRHCLCLCYQCICGLVAGWPGLSENVGIVTSYLPF